MNTTLSLYTPLVPGNKYDPVYRQSFAKGNVTITLRPLQLTEDWPFISRWLLREITRKLPMTSHLPEKHLRETYSIMLECDFAQPLMGLINEQPAFLIEICHGEKQGNGLDEGPHDFISGDHSIRLLLSPTITHIRHGGDYTLFTCLHYFFSFNEVQRLVWELHERDRQLLQLAQHVGFDKSIGRRWQGIQVYLYSREKYQLLSDIYPRYAQKQT
ncbi:GNAT family N-acetyltransferase [Longitalea luteola]|uniref:GNAT family N-acetyltransferase n=1 Tax=Longitalea luteola TaxID=2812563 RepID=UPI001A959F39|nr:GNAT family N-acetyltransferase [Longitalea luteola]